MGMPFGTQIDVLKNKEYLYNLYIIEKKSMRTIARQLGCGETLIHKLMHRYEIPMRTRSSALKNYTKPRSHVMNIANAIRRNGSMKGANHPMWKDVIKRDNHECQLCGESDGVMHAHHIKKFSIYIEDRYVMTNIITLCQTCHRTVHHSHGEAVCF